MSTVACTLATALLIYAIYVILILRQISKLIDARYSWRPRGTRVAPIGGPWGVDLYGYFVPLWMIIVLWLLLPTTWVALEFVHWVQRRNRERLGLCIGCGCRLATPWRGKCPRCGLRVGVG